MSGITSPTIKKNSNSKGYKKLTKSVTYNAEDIKKMLAEKYGVPEKYVIKAQYSYTVLLPDEEKK